MCSRQITVHLNILVQDKLNDIEDFNNYVDKILSEYFNITFEEAYPEGRKLKWPEINHEI